MKVTMRLMMIAFVILHFFTTAKAQTCTEECNTAPCNKCINNINTAQKDGQRYFIFHALWLDIVNLGTGVLYSQAYQTMNNNPCFDANMPTRSSLQWGRLNDANEFLPCSPAVEFVDNGNTLASKSFPHRAECEDVFPNGADLVIKVVNLQPGCPTNHVLRFPQNRQFFSINCVNPTLWHPSLGCCPGDMQLGVRREIENEIPGCCTVTFSTDRPNPPDSTTVVNAHRTNYEVACGKVITLQANTPHNAFEFVGWEGDMCEDGTSINVCQTRADQSTNQVAVARWARRDITVRVRIDGCCGSIRLGGDISGPFDFVVSDPTVASREFEIQMKVQENLQILQHNYPITGVEFAGQCSECTESSPLPCECSDGLTGTPLVVVDLIVCGNGLVQSPETCDDNNRENGDGCNRFCQTQQGFTCVGAPSVCTPICGDGLIRGSETCDDGNIVSGDGCSSLCQSEISVCGDGSIDGPETCDDGDTQSNDGCSSTCQVEEGWTCNSVPSTCTPICGDGLIRGTEACDDDDTDNGDGCSSACIVEQGWSCVGEASVCTTICGDGLVRGSETCDDGNLNNNDGCSSTCTIEDPCSPNPCNNPPDCRTAVGAVCTNIDGQASCFYPLIPNCNRVNPIPPNPIIPVIPVIPITTEFECHVLRCFGEACETIHRADGTRCSSSGNNGRCNNGKCIVEVPAEDDDDNNSGIVAIVVGAVGGVLLICCIVAGVIFVVRYRRHTANSPYDETPADLYYPDSCLTVPVPMYSSTPSPFLPNTPLLPINNSASSVLFN